MSLQEVEFQELVDFYDHIRIPLSGMEREKRQGPYRYYGAQSIIDHVDDYLFDGEYVLIAEDGANLVTRNEPIAQVVSGQFWVNNHAHIVQAKEGVSTNNFINYLVNSNNISGYVTGAAQPKLSQKNLRVIKFNVPSYEEQLAIDNSISKYDDLIENNKRRIELLEESARQLYKEWFVRFRFPGHEHVKIIDGVPEGWNEKLFEEVAEVRNGFAFKSADYSSEGMPVIRTRDFSATRYIFRDEDIRIPEYMLEKYKKYQLNRLDFLLIMVGASLGKYGIVTEKDLPALQNQNMWAIYTKNEEEYPQVYLIEMMQELIHKFLNYRVGAAREFFRKDFVKKQQIIVPPKGLLNEFVETTGGVYKQIEILLLQNEKLTKARDLLLPKLMSGEIAV